MAIKRETLVMVEEWKIKCFDLSNKPDYRDDPLVSVMLRGFDTLWIIANGCDSNRIRRALDSLECERSLCLRSENTGVTPIRTTMYGLIQSFHGILLDMTARKDTISVEIQTDEKCYQLSLELGITSPNDLISMETQTDEKSSLLPLEPVISLIKTSCNTEPKEVLMDKTTVQITRDTVEEIKEEVIENDDMNLHMDDGQLEVNNSTNRMSAIGVQDQPASKIITKVTPENVKKPKEEPVDPTLVIPNLNKTTISEDMAAYYAIPEEEVDNFEINCGTEEWNSMAEDVNENKGNQDENAKNENNDMSEKGTLQITRDSMEERQEEEIMNDDMDFPVDDGPLELNTSNIEHYNGVQDHPVINVIPKLTEDQKKPKKEPVNPDPVILNLNQTTISEDMAAYYAIPEEEVDNFDINLGTEEWDSMVEDANENEDNQEENVNNDNIDMSKDSFNMDMTARRKSLRSANKTMKYVESDVDSEVDEPSMKKVKSESEKGKGKMMKSHKKEIPEIKSVTKKERLWKDNDTELKCPECEYRTMNVTTWVNHLKNAHGTTPALTNLALRCQCGNESFGDRHSRFCDISKIIIIRKDGGEYRLVRKNATELKCPKCKFTTLSVGSWIYHLGNIHSTSIAKLDLLLRCDCGHETVTDKHNRMCEIANFTVIRREDATIKALKKSNADVACPECEYRTKCGKTWINHLYSKHSTNPTKLGLALRCECGHEGTSGWHYRTCDIANFTVIRKSGEPIEESNKDDEKECQLDNSDVLRKTDKPIGRKEDRELTLNDMEEE